MKTDHLENELRKLKFTHLNEVELTAYCDQLLDLIGCARVEAHLKQCFICEGLLEQLREESAALRNRRVTADDVALVERLIEQTDAGRQAPAVSAAEMTGLVALQDRLTGYLRQMVASWQLAFRQVRRAVEGEVVWQWQSDDGCLQARASLEENGELTIRFSSNELALEGARITFRLGELSQVMTMQQVSETEVAAQISLLSWQHRGDMTDVSIERV